VIAGTAIEPALGSIGLAPDWEVIGGGDAPVMVLHRHLADGEIYFVTNRKNAPLSLEMAFRVAGRTPESWDAATGDRRPVGYRTDGQRTVVPVVLDGDGSALIVFRTPTRVASRIVAAPAERVAAALDTGWTVTFQQGRGAPATHDVAGTGSWTESGMPGVKYFSGTATYRTTWTPGGGMRAAGRRVILDLGDVREIAEVLVNGRPVRTLWKPPYRVDVTKALTGGANAIEVRVTNLWVNRLIGDAQEGAEKVTFTVSPPYNGNAPLRPSGLIGPVRVVTTEPR
jgi:hypothetical protein